MHEDSEIGDERSLWQRALPEGFDTLLRGAFDVHVHGQPDLSPDFLNRGSDVDVARLAHGYGISGWVLKSHLWQTTDRARLIQEQLDGLDFAVYGSITLNPVMGGLDATVVELAAAHGARVIFLPTWGASADVARGGYIAEKLRSISPSFDAYSRRSAISLLDSNGRLTPAAIDVLDACQQLGLSLATGHCALAESRAVAEYCAGRQPILLTHPIHYIEHARELRDFTDLGVFIEFCNSPIVHPDAHVKVRDVHDAITEIGPDQVILSTDVFSRWAPPEPECLRMFAEQLAYLGWQPDQLHTMLADNPRRFLGLTPA